MTTDLVAFIGCPDCGSLDLHDFSWIEEPLVRGGGYGGARMTTRRVCGACGWEIRLQVGTIRPMRRRERVGVP
jgi:hypothetical protein